MSGSPRRCRLGHEEDISGQFRVTVPDAGELDQLRTRGSVQEGTVYIWGVEIMRLLRGFSLYLPLPWKSSMEPMDTADAQRASEEIYQRIRQQAGLSQSGSAGDVTPLPEPTVVMTQGRFTRSEETGEQTWVVTSSIREQSIRDTDTTAGAVGGETLLNIPPCSMAEEPGEQSQSLFRPPMSDPELNLEHQRGAKPKAAGSLTTQTIQEEA